MKIENNDESEEIINVFDQSFNNLSAYFLFFRMKTLKKSLKMRMKNQKT